MNRFPRVLGVRTGYDPEQVDALIQRIEATLGRGLLEGPPVTADEIRMSRFNTKLGGYNEVAVDYALDAFVVAVETRGRPARAIPQAGDELPDEQAQAPWEGAHSITGATSPEVPAYGAPVEGNGSRAKIRPFGGPGGSPAGSGGGEAGSAAESSHESPEELMEEDEAPTLPELAKPIGGPGSPVGVSGYTTGERGKPFGEPGTAFGEPGYPVEGLGKPLREPGKPIGGPGNEVGGRPGRPGGERWESRSVTGEPAKGTGGLGRSDASVAADEPAVAEALTAAWMETQAVRVERVLFRPGRLGAGYNEDEVDVFLDRIVATLRGTTGHPLTAEQVRKATFSTVVFKSGYAVAQVDAFLAEIADVLDRGDARVEDQEQRV
ncbi:hypothetical protein GCM10022226_64020 [Sphaerisporangium flaviroseum]|uniref:Cell wall synthesis protein Wag31 n=1 Tax=Sphaerisporangium flaviroseum TaxID=509199 RepID=A0ABP7J4K2_9ACTN